METKMITIPFDVERAKKIQAGEEPGKIVTREGCDVRIVCWDVKDNDFPIVAALTSLEDKNNESVLVFKEDGRSCHHENFKEDGFDLLLQVPEWTQCKKGDVVSCEIDDGDGEYKRWYGIVKKVDCTIEGDTNGYVEFVVIWNLEHRNETDYVEQNYFTNHFDCINLATEEEKRRFIEELKKYTHDSDMKKILKEYFGIEEKQECEFEPFQQVLVRDDCKRRWVCALFNFYDRRKETSYPFVCIGGSFRYCIPYNDQTKHLLGTTDDWEK